MFERRLMTELRSVVEALRAQDLAAVPDQVLEEDFGALHRAAELLEAERLRRLAELDRRRPFERDGHLSTSSWLAHRFRVSPGAAGADVRVARALEAMPETGEALASGEVSASAVRVLAAAREADPDAFAEAESLLVDAARRHPIKDLQRAVGHWRALAQDRRSHGEAGEDPLRERRRLHVSATVFGMVRIDGDLDPDTGETVLTALRAVVDAELRSSDPEDHRTPAQRRADAMGEICRRWLDDTERPLVGGERPHVTVTMDVEALRGGAGGRAEFDHAGAITGESGRLWACDAAITRLITTGRSEPLDVGRKTAVVPAAMRRAVMVRDGGCRFPGCDRPPGWTDCHHVVHWGDGGHTAVQNLVLLCRRHHRLIHQGFGVEMVAGRPVFRRPDGTILEVADPPSTLHDDPAWSVEGPVPATARA